MDERDAAVEPWWGDLDGAVMACLAAKGPLSPNEIGHHVGLSESAAASLLCLLALEGKVRICLVEHPIARSSAASRAA